MKKHMKKFIVMLCVVCMVFSVGTVAYAGNEPNDNKDDATYLGYGNNIRQYGLVSSVDTEDWWFFYANDSSPYQIHLQWGTKNEFDADLYLYNEEGELLVKAPPSGNRWHTIKDYYLRKSKKYYIRVKYNSGCLTHNPYLLHLEKMES